MSLFFFFFRKSERQRETRSPSSCLFPFVLPRVPPGIIRDERAPEPRSACSQVTNLERRGSSDVKILTLNVHRLPVDAADRPALGVV